ncbi:MAG: DUF1573 domain-containing protein [Gemmataceae bacterium]|nr:DUF1573 domain-containing protein [Gemmataceae bacterium]
MIAARKTIGTPQPQPAQELPDIDLVAHGAFDLGTRFESPSVRATFTLVNTKSATVTVRSMFGSCDCLDVAPRAPFEIPPGESREVTATFALRMQSDCVRAKGLSETTPLPVRVTYSLPGETDRNVVVPFRCQLRPSLRLSALTLPIGLQSIRQRDLTQTLELEAGEHVERIEVAPTPFWSVSISPEVYGPTRKGRVTLRAVGTLDPRVIADRLVFTPIDRTGQRLPETGFHVVGEYTADVVGIPREVRLGRVRVGSRVEDVVRIRSLTRRPVVVKSVSSASESLVIEPADRRDGSPAYRVTFGVARVGDLAAEIHFELVDEGDVRTNLVVPVRATGVTD